MVGRTKKKQKKNSGKEYEKGYMEGAYWCVRTKKTDMVDTNIRQGQNYGAHHMYIKGLFCAKKDYLENIKDAIYEHAKEQKAIKDREIP